MIEKSTKILHILLRDNREEEFDLLLDGIKTVLKKFPVTWKTYDIYNNVKKNLLVREKLLDDSQWSPRFAPQVTIQHSLENTIFLYFSLFGFNTIYMNNFSASLPYKKILSRLKKKEIVKG
ncbi:MAG: hypothetical protein BGO77_08475 [Caedibacter sp. 37-49]|nr:MAG: hypothetical protein BGO77_08475 [Caedibacter sp. 37-49]